jgi:hypothetical protein
MSAKSVGYTVFELDGVALGEEAFEKAKLNPKEAKLVGLTLLFGIFVYIGYELFKPKPDSGKIFNFTTNMYLVLFQHWNIQRKSPSRKSPNLAMSKNKKDKFKKSENSENFEQRDFIHEEKCKLKSTGKLEMSTMESDTSYTNPEYASLPVGNNPVLPSASL